MANHRQLSPDGETASYSYGRLCTIRWSTLLTTIRKSNSDRGIISGRQPTKFSDLMTVISVLDMFLKRSLFWSCFSGRFSCYCQYPCILVWHPRFTETPIHRNSNRFLWGFLSTKEIFKGFKLDWWSFQSLENLFLMDGAIAHNLWGLSSLESLDLSETGIHRIPAGITECCSLTHLIIRHCKKLKEIPKLPSSLRHIDAYGCTGLGTLSTPSSLLWSSLLKWSQLRLPYSNYCRRIILGSNEIPEWVLHQEMGSQIRIELPMNWYQDDHFLGFAFFRLCSTMHRSLMNCRLTFCGDSEEDIRDFGFDSGFRYFMIDDSEFDGLWVEYCPKMAILNRFHSKQYVHLQASFVYQRYGGWGDDVESCGIHLIYSQDHQHNHTQLGFS